MVRPDDQGTDTMTYATRFNHVAISFVAAIAFTALSVLASAPAVTIA
jgi:hypothetical protein